MKAQNVSLDKNKENNGNFNELVGM